LSEVIKKAKEAKAASFELMTLPASVKNRALKNMADALCSNVDAILEENRIDVESAKKSGKTGAFIDRLTLNEKRVKDMAEGIRTVESLPDPVGETIAMWRRPNGLEIGQRRVPIGVIGIIYEARPNVTADAIALCLKSGNAVVLRGGSEAVRSNKVISDILAEAAYKAGIPQGSIQFMEDTSREAALELMRLNGLIDILIPRGGAGLIKTVMEQASVPVIETGVGNCHVYVDGECDQSMALNIVINAKTQRPGVCNAAETLLVDKALAHEFLPLVIAELKNKGVSVRGCPETLAIVSDCLAATEEDWYTEYLDLIIAVKVVDGLDQAISHINHYGTKHSEAIITTNYFKARSFQERVDAAAVYVNSSTRFTDGFEFGFGAEIGISTQKMHARGPMGLKELTTIKYVIFGNGQVRG
jgi:glutamate-5-semialdehyde dehydrogenase